MNFYANILESKQPVIGDSYFIQTKEGTEDWLKEMRIKNYIINDNLIVDVNGTANLSFNNLLKIPVMFGKIIGNFNCGQNELTSLKGCPEIVNGDFYCHNNKLTSLEYFPIVNSNIEFSDNPIKTLRGLKSVSADLLIKLLVYYVELDWKEIEWDKVKDLDEIVAELYESIEKGENTKHCKEALERIEELQLYQEEL